MCVTDHNSPVATYDDAQAWLWRFSKVEEWLFDPDVELPPEARLVCAVYWIDEQKLLRDLRKAWNEVAGYPRSAPPRHLLRGSLCSARS